MAVSVPPPVVIALGTCPAHVRRLRAADVPAAERAVLSMLPTLAARVRPALRLRGAHVDVARFVRLRGDVLPARRCSPQTIRRSVLVGIVLPAERASPSLRGSPAYDVARTGAGWVIWFQPH